MYSQLIDLLSLSIAIVLRTSFSWVFFALNSICEIDEPAKFYNIDLKHFKVSFQNAMAAFFRPYEVDNKNNTYFLGS